MTYKKALEQTEKSIEICEGENDSTNLDYWRKVKEAIEKQIPKKPIPRYDKGLLEKRIVSYICPCCNNDYLGQNEYAFDCCEYCGQALDWSEDDDLR